MPRPTIMSAAAARSLLVLRRAMLAVEDLGGLLYALEEPPSFQRLVSYNLDDLSALFTRVFADPTLTPALLVWRLPTRAPPSQASTTSSVRC